MCVCVVCVCFFVLFVCVRVDMSDPCEVQPPVFRTKKGVRLIHE